MREPAGGIAILNWAVSTFFVLFQFFLQASAGLMAERWQLDFNLTSTQVGSLSGAFFITYVLLQIPVGIAYDRYGPRRVLILASMLMCAGTFAMAYSQTYAQALLSRAIMGVGSSFGFVGMLYVTGSWFSNHYFAMLVGVAETLGMMGVALSEVGFAWQIQHYGWRTTMLMAGWIALFVCAAVIVVIRVPRNKAIKNTVPTYSFKAIIEQIIHNRQLWLAGLYGFSAFSVVTVVANLWGIAYLTSTYPVLQLADAGAMMSVIYVGVAVGGPTCAWVVQRWHKRREIMMIYMYVLTILVVYTFCGKHAQINHLYYVFFIMGFFCSSYILVFAVVKDSVSEGLKGTALASVNMLVMLNAPLLQPLVGWMLHIGLSYAQSFLAMMIPMFLMCLMVQGLDKDETKSECKKPER